MDAVSYALKLNAVCFCFLLGLLVSCRGDDETTQGAIDSQSKESSDQSSLKLDASENPEDSIAVNIGQEIASLSAQIDYGTQLNAKLSEGYETNRENITTLEKMTGSILASYGYAGTHGFQSVPNSIRNDIRYCINNVPRVSSSPHLNPFSQEGVTSSMMPQGAEQLLNDMVVMFKEKTAEQFWGSSPALYLKCAKYHALISMLAPVEFTRQFHKTLSLQIYDARSQVFDLLKDLKAEKKALEKELAAFRDLQNATGTQGNAAYNPFKNYKDSKRPFDYILSDQNPLVRALSEAGQSILASSASVAGGTAGKRSYANFEGIRTYFTNGIPEWSKNQVKMGKFKSEKAAYGYALLMMFTPWRLAKGLTGEVYVKDPMTSDVTDVDGSGLLLDATTFAALGKLALAIGMTASQSSLVAQLKALPQSATNRTELSSKLNLIQSQIKILPSNLVKNAQTIIFAEQTRTMLSSALKRLPLEFGEESLEETYQMTLEAQGATITEGTKTKSEKAMQGVIDQVKPVLNSVYGN